MRATRKQWNEILAILKENQDFLVHAKQFEAADKLTWLIAEVYNESWGTYDDIVLDVDVSSRELLKGGVLVQLRDNHEITRIEGGKFEVVRRGSFPFVKPPFAMATL